MNPIVHIYTDGSCLGNGQPTNRGGWAFVMLLDGKLPIEKSGSETNTSNNRMELKAIIEALKAVPNETEVHIHTDSSYAKDGVTKWLSKWVKNDWQTKDKQPVKNRDLWEELIKASELKYVVWHWVRGHNGDIHNERADQLAQTAARAL